ncbi:MAG: hypothetical protein HXK70_03030 [Clostridiales bacterium]|jgi:hypothetical protein|nr:hypothetical protein [Clostridiales bacterium]
MNIKITNISSGEETIKDHKKLVKKLVEKGRVTRQMRDHLFENPQDLLKKLNLIRFNNSKYEEA